MNVEKIEKNELLVAVTDFKKIHDLAINLIDAREEEICLLEVLK